MIAQCLAILGVGLLGGLLPLVTRWSYRGLHVALALSTGVFLGAVFLHMLPELGSLSEGGHAHGVAAAAHAEEDGHAHDTEHATPMVIWSAVLLGVLAVYFVETLLVRARPQRPAVAKAAAAHDHAHGAEHAHTHAAGSACDHDHGHADPAELAAPADAHEAAALQHHRAVGWASLVGLTLHAATTGFGLAAATAEGLAQPVFLAILSHKAFESFSLSSVFRLAAFPARRILLLVVLFALVTPAGALAGGAVLHQLSGVVLDVVLALAAGTFLYVCLCELLPEVFHHRADGLRKVVLLLAGILVMGLLHGLEG